MVINDLALREEAYHLAQQLLGKGSKESFAFTNRLLDIYNKAQDKDFLLIHNPGGFGNKELDRCLQWERSVVFGIRDTIEKWGYTQLLIQHFRAATGWLKLIRNTNELFHVPAHKVNVLATQVEFLVRHTNNLNVILIGVSQGAAFGNAVMQRLAELRQVYSIELGMFFSYKSLRVIGERTLAIDGNGVVPDLTFQRDLKAISKTYLTAPYRWLKYQLQGKPMAFTYCINVPGHNYNWSYPKVQQPIIGFLKTNFGTKNKG